MNRPSLDDLKRERDGQLSAGRPPPACLYCGEAVGPGAVRMHLDGVDPETGGRTARLAFAHDACFEEHIGDGGES